MRFSNISDSDKDFTSLSTSDILQDPFLPIEIPSGPAFLDTEACLCSYRQDPITTSNNLAWECIGNQADGIQETTKGKWFRPIHNATTDDTQDFEAIWDASNGPNTATPLMYDVNQDSLVLVNSSALDVHDAACTGQNQTTFSTAFYRAVEERKNNETMVDAMPCWRGPYAIPLQIMGLADWQQYGCNEGFLCENNTVNSLPQYCPPIEACQDSRAAGDVCRLNQSNSGTGPFEPVVCQGGYYCPKGGAVKLLCPAGHYCQPGTATPRPCLVGSLCPEGSISQTFYLPVIFLLVLDLFLVFGMVLTLLRNRTKKASSSHLVTAYKSLDNESDMESGSGSPTEESAAPELPAFTGSRALLSTEPAPSVRSMDDTIIEEEELNPTLMGLVESMRKATNTSLFGLSFRYDNLTYHPRGSPRPILYNVTGSIRQGNLTAIMGGSGAGKSTFVNVLMGKLTNTGGVVRVNDVPNKVRAYRKLIGYVPQDDIVLPELTVRENILHSARVRLPRRWTDAEIRTHVDRVIECLDLSHVRDSPVGTVGKPLISGGQRKRVSIGMELAAAPMAIFLDEPTSGLDATSASSIMNVLKSIARLGISVIVTIHQPRLQIIDILDELIFLANGQIVCQGPQGYVQAYFEGLGFKFPQHTNFGDVVTDIITGNGRLYKTRGSVSVEYLINSWRYSQKSVKGGADSSITLDTSSTLDASTVYVESSRYNRKSRHIISLAGIGRVLRLHTVHDQDVHDSLKGHGASRLQQIWLCLRRAMLQQWRHKVSFWTEMTLSSLAAFLLGLAQHSKNGVLFRGLYKGTFDMLSPAVDLESAPQFALLLGVAIGLISAGPGVRAFSEEILLQRREAEAGHSRLAYFLAKVLATLPRMVLACLHFSVIVLFLSRLLVPWTTAFAANLAYFWCIYGMASVVSMLVRREDAPLLATMVSLIMGILCGAAPSLSTVRSWHMAWLWRMSPGVWLSELYFGELVRPYDYLYRTEIAAAVTGYSLNHTARNLGVLVAIGVAFRLMAYIGLIGGKKLRV